jgi:hypothetical protein
MRMLDLIQAARDGDQWRTDEHSNEHSGCIRDGGGGGLMI